MPSSNSLDQLISKSSSLSPETKEILSFFASMINELRDEHEKTLIKLNNCLKEQAESFTKRLEDMQTSIQSTVSQLRQEIKAALDERDYEITKNRNDFSEAQSESNKLFKKLKDEADAQDAYGRRESLIFSGDLIPAFSANENCTQIVRTIIRENLVPELDPLLSTAHRLGKPPASNTSPDKRSIIAKFIVRDNKHRVLTEARTKKVRGLFVAESLTPTRSAIFHKLRIIRKSNQKVITGLHTHNGRIFVSTLPALNAPSSSNSIRTEINTMDRLESFCEGFLRKPLASFLTPSQMD